MRQLEAADLLVDADVSAAIAFRDGVQSLHTLLTGIDSSTVPIDVPDLVRSVFMGGAAGGTRAISRKAYVEVATTPALEVSGIDVRFGAVVGHVGVFKLCAVFTDLRGQHLGVEVLRIKIKLNTYPVPTLFMPLILRRCEEIKDCVRLPLDVMNR